MKKHGEAAKTAAAGGLQRTFGCAFGLALSVSAHSWLQRTPAQRGWPQAPCTASVRIESLARSPSRA